METSCKFIVQYHNQGSDTDKSQGTEHFHHYKNPSCCLCIAHLPPLNSNSSLITQQPQICFPFPFCHFKNVTQIESDSLYLCGLAFFTQPNFLRVTQAVLLIVHSFWFLSSILRYRCATLCSTIHSLKNI